MAAKTREIEVLNKIRSLSNGKFGKDIVISGDAQIVLVRLMDIYALSSNRIGEIRAEQRAKVGKQ